MAFHLGHSFPAFADFAGLADFAAELAFLAEMVLPIDPVHYT